jgi:hypothetical protein
MFDFKYIDQRCIYRLLYVCMYVCMYVYAIRPPGIVRRKRKIDALVNFLFIFSLLCAQVERSMILIVLAAIDAD